MHLVIDGRMINNTGIGRVIKNLVHSLAQAPGCQFTLLVNPGAGFKADYPNLKVKELRIPCPIYSVKEQLWLPVELARLKPDLVHFLNFNVPLVKFWPSLVTIHDITYYLFPEACPHWLGHIYARMMMRVAVRARRVITDSQFSAQELKKYLRVSEKKVKVIHCAVDEKCFYPLDKAWAREKIKNKYGIKKKFIFYVGNHEPRKNLLRLVQAFCHLEGRKDYQLVIGGRIDLRRAYLYNEVKRLSLAEEVILTDEIAEEDLPIFYNGAQVFAFPSLYEGFGLPPLEAMACGTAVLAANAASLPEVVGDAALIIDPLDTASIRDGLERLLADTFLRDKLVAKGLERVKAFSWDRAASEHLAVYKEALGEG